MTDEEWLALETEAILNGPRVGMPVRGVSSGEAEPMLGRVVKVTSLPVLTGPSTFSVEWDPDAQTGGSALGGVLTYRMANWAPDSNVWVRRV